jgi:hypothetical protein
VLRNEQFQVNNPIFVVSQQSAVLDILLDIIFSQSLEVRPKYPVMVGVELVLIETLVDDQDD